MSFVEHMAKILQAKRFEHWKSANVLVVALESMPEQVDKDKIKDDLLKLYGKFMEDLTSGLVSRICTHTQVHACHAFYGC